MTEADPLPIRPLRRASQDWRVDPHGARFLWQR